MLFLRTVIRAGGRAPGRRCSIHDRCRTLASGGTRYARGLSSGARPVSFADLTASLIERRDVGHLLDVMGPAHGAGKIRVYTNLARNDWIPTTLGFEGAVEVATYRNPMQNSPQVLVVIGFTDLPAWQHYIASDEYERIMRDLRILGCTGIMTRVWIPSRLTPEPIRSGDLPLSEPAALPH